MSDESTGPIEYVAGFLIDTDCVEVVLIKKRKPPWQAGKLNAVGGKIEPNESSIAAMQREFEEETGVSIPVWHGFCTLSGQDFVVNFFYAIASSRRLYNCTTLTDEMVSVYSIPRIINSAQRRVPLTLPNIPWLLSMALSFVYSDEGCDAFKVIEVSK
jgi:8-oxo-dGTP diphosphatase